MALSRRTGARLQASIWPGFVDAMTGLLLVLMFVLTIFMMVQFVLREEISGQATQLDSLSAEVAALSRALGLEQDRNATLQDRVGALTATLGDARAREAAQIALIDRLRTQTSEQAEALETARSRIASFEEQVAGLLSDRAEARDRVADLEDERAALLSEQDTLQLTLANLRDEIDAQAEAARLAAARREALQALTEDLQRRNAESDAARDALGQKVTALQEELSEQEQARLAEAAAAEALRAKLEEADSELSAMTLALEEQRKRAEETLTLLAAAETAREDLNSQLAQALLETEQTAATREAEIARLQTELSQARSGMAETGATLDKTRADLAETSGTLDETRAELAQTRDRLAQTQAELSRTREQLAQALARAEDLQGATLEAAEIRERLTAALAARRAAEARAEDQLDKAEQRAALLAEARARLSEEQQAATEAQKQRALLNQQVTALRNQLSGLQSLLDAAEERETEAEVQLQSLGNQLNTALARVAAEERRRRIAEEERARLLEAENEDLEKYRSEFFGRLREVLGDQEGIKIVGDRFVFSSEVLFAPGEAQLSRAGEQEIAKVADILRGIIDEIPKGIDWILQVDGHTDNVPLIGGARFADNWALSQARALSVVRYLTGFLGFPPDRLSANGYGEYQPVNPANTPEARAQNRRIELKLTTR